VCSGFQVLYSDFNVTIAVFVRKGKDGNAELVLLDHGLYDCLKQPDRINLCHLYKAIVNKDQEGMEHFSLQLGVKGCYAYYIDFSPFTIH
jgi:predicted unusual protein kinase regulating ubiquinone biosynthesis (AarF/ABC1/UbiB family)